MPRATLTHSPCRPYRAHLQRKGRFFAHRPGTFLAFTHRDLVTQSALKAGLPLFAPPRHRAPSQMHVWPVLQRQQHRSLRRHKTAQVLVDRVPVQNIAAETLQRFSLLINMPTVKTLDLYPPLVLLNVAEVVK